MAISLARIGGIQTGLITKRISETVALRARDLKLEHISIRAFRTNAPAWRKFVLNANSNLR